MSRLRLWAVSEGLCAVQILCDILIKLGPILGPRIKQEAEADTECINVSEDDTILSTNGDTIHFTLISILFIGKLYDVSIF